MIRRYQQDGDADLQQDPDHNHNVAVDEESGAKVLIALLVRRREAVHPCLAGREAEHGAQGAEEVVEVGRRGLAEEGDAHDGVCTGTGPDQKHQLQQLRGPAA
jgi:hypothetical protein